MDDILASDAFIDALSRGDDPSAGHDPLAAALLDLKAEVDQPMTPAPQLAADEAPQTKQVASLDVARERKAKKRQVSPWLSGLIGAAAATVVCVGTGAALFDNSGANEDTTVVELATTLDELEAANQTGDAEAARTLLEQARGLVNTMKERERASRNGEPMTVTKTVTDTTTASNGTTERRDRADEPEQPAQPEQAPAAPAPSQQPTAKPAPAERPAQPAQPTQQGTGTGTSVGTATATAQPTAQHSTTAQQPGASGETVREQANEGPRVNDPATMQPPAQPVGDSGAAGPVVVDREEGGPVVRREAGSS